MGSRDGRTRPGRALASLAAAVVLPMLAGQAAPVAAQEDAGAGLRCAVTASFVDEDATFALVFFDVEYGDSGGHFAGEGREVTCTTMQAAGSFTDRDLVGESKLRVGLSGLGDNIENQVPLATCIFLPGDRELPVPGLFTITTLAALDPSGRVNAEVPEIEVSQIACASSAAFETEDGSVTTSTTTTTTPTLFVATTTSTSTTTLPPPVPQQAATTSSTVVWATLLMSTTTSTSTLPEGSARCGNSRAETGEQCDDGNVLDGDGCDSNCRFTGCGNGIVTAGEECDDGNTDNGDGCSSECTVAVCGNNIVESGEECDDGNTDNGDGCSSICTAIECGNNIVDLGEQCDDGNTDDGDGCDSSCRIELAEPVCGNGVLESGETCDDGNSNSDFEPDACRSDCSLAGCGDGVVDGGEECDSGAGNISTFEWDGSTQGLCSTGCLVIGCGNGRIDTGEGCDDGNTADGDGCSSVCQEEIVVTTTSSTSTTTTTLPLGRRECQVHFEITSTGNLESLQLTVDYSTAPGNFIGVGDDVECSIFAAMVGIANDNDGTRVLSVAAIDFVGFNTPVRVASCGFESGPTEPLPAEFGITLIDFGVVSGAPEPAVEAAVECGDVDQGAPTPSFLRRATLCGDADGSGHLTAGDALAILKAAVNIATCPAGRCDADGNGSVSVADALLVLKAALDMPVKLSCG